MICSQTAQLTVLVSVVPTDAVFDDFLGLDVPFVEDFAEVDVDEDVDVGEPAEVVRYALVGGISQYITTVREPDGTPIQLQPVQLFLDTGLQDITQLQPVHQQLGK